MAGAEDQMTQTLRQSLQSSMMLLRCQKMR